MESAEIVRKLERAKEVLYEDGWTKGKSHRDGQHCAVGAVEVACGTWANGDYLLIAGPDTDSLMELDVLGFLNNVAKRRIGYEGISIYNDMDATTFGDIIGCFDEAILDVKATVQ